MDEDIFFDVVIEKALLGFLTTAIVAVLTLSAVPKADLTLTYMPRRRDISGALRFSADTSSSGLSGVGPWACSLRTGPRALFVGWFAGGTITWGIGTQALIAHFGIPDWEGYQSFNCYGFLEMSGSGSLEMSDSCPGRCQYPVAGRESARFVWPRLLHGCCASGCGA